jgi:hypothetical protein
MATTAVTAALAEIVAALATIPPQHEGLKDFARLNLKPETLVEIRTSLEQYDRRVRLLEAAQKANEVLLADGYPALEPREISDAAYQDLQTNKQTIDAALQQFTSPTPATTLGLAAGAVEPK